MRALEEYLTKIKDEEVKRFAQDAVGAYNAGIHRLAIVSIWVAACVDIAGKVRHLATEGVLPAQTWVCEISKAQGQRAPVAELLKRERESIQIARDLEIVSDAEFELLERLRVDRHRCAHPMLYDEPGFDPSAELARSHLVHALDFLLTSPPVQGDAAIKRFKTFLASGTSTSATEHILRTLVDPIRPSGKRRIVDLALKISLRGERLESESYSTQDCDRSAAILASIAVRERKLVHEVMSKHSAPTHLSALTHIQIGNALNRLGGLDVFWETLGEALKPQIAELIQELNIECPDDEPFFRALRHKHAETEMSALIDQVRTLKPNLCMKAIIVAESPIFLDDAVKSAPHVRSYRGAEDWFHKCIEPFSHELSLTQLESLLSDWSSNNQIAGAHGMVPASARLFESTKHLWPESQQVWTTFINQREVGESSDHYHYHDLRQVYSQAIKAAPQSNQNT